MSWGLRGLKGSRLMFTVSCIALIAVVLAGLLVLTGAPWSSGIGPRMVFESSYVAEGWLVLVLRNTGDKTVEVERIVMSVWDVPVVERDVDFKVRPKHTLILSLPAPTGGGLADVKVSVVVKGGHVFEKTFTVPCCHDLGRSVRLEVCGRKLILYGVLAFKVSRLDDSFSFTIDNGLNVTVRPGDTVVLELCPQGKPLAGYRLIELYSNGSLRAHNIILRELTVNGVVVAEYCVVEELRGVVVSSTLSSLGLNVSTHPSGRMELYVNGVKLIGSDMDASMVSLVGLTPTSSCMKLVMNKEGYEGEDLVVGEVRRVVVNGYPIP